MKRSLLIIPLLAFLFLSLEACSFSQNDTSKPSETTVLTDTPKQTGSSSLSGSTLIDELKPTLTNNKDDFKSIIESRSKEVVALIKAKDMEALSKVIHPDKGVRFSPYSHVDLKSDLVFSAKQIKDIKSDNKQYKWGIFDGSGEPIVLNFDSYYKKFIYDEDFVNAKQVGYNKILGSGNTINNSFEVYPKAIIVEYYFPGFDPQYSGMDWRSLKLVFEKKADIWYLIGIIHDQWTI
jgi:hypothetical protein